VETLYYTGSGVSGWKSSDSGSNFRIYKIGDKLRISYASGYSAGSTIGMWGSESTNVAMAFDNSGRTGVGTVSPNSLLQVNGSFAVKRTGTAVSLSTDDEVIIGVTNTAANRTIRLSTSDCVAGRIVIVKDESNGAQSHNITVDTEGSEKIDGADSKLINTNYGVLRLYSNGSHWFTF
jgi:hypothetical protein